MKVVQAAVVAAHPQDPVRVPQPLKRCILVDTLPIQRRSFRCRPTKGGMELSDAHGADNQACRKAATSRSRRLRTTSCGNRKARCTKSTTDLLRGWGR